MSWNPQTEVHYMNTSYPYSNTGSFMEYFEGLTYEHVNFIFSGASHAQVYIRLRFGFYNISSSLFWSKLQLLFLDDFIVSICDD